MGLGTGDNPSLGVEHRCYNLSFDGNTFPQLKKSLFMSNDLKQKRNTMVSLALFSAVTFLIAWDLVFDYTEGASLIHLVVETALFLVALSGSVILWLQLRQTRIDLADAKDELAGAKIEADQWRRESRELIRGLAVAIEHQFERWELTQAEAEVGLLMLKGLSHKEIAQVRDTSERTIREQARAVYRKSGLSGRSALSAFFLEDLLLPPEVKD